MFTRARKYVNPISPLTCKKHNTCKRCSEKSSANGVELFYTIDLNSRIITLVCGGIFCGLKTELLLLSCSTL